MYDYIIGKVTNINSTYIVLECGGIGYVIYTPNPYSFSENSEYKVYLYQLVREDELSLYGFKTIEEKELFLKLISVKGLGPKMTLPILATGSVSGVIDAIERENLLYLRKFPKIGDKLAKQIVLDLKGKLGVISSVEVNNSSYEELVEVLKGLGYKEKEFKAIIPKISCDLTIEEQVKEALKLLLK
ncbi:MAG: Holliday junction branch migration protein RuvA [Bacilli bacterium]|nr:Holliday junction branch migration protein RuvA [Bacilli bacterium]